MNHQLILPQYRQAATNKMGVKFNSVGVYIPTEIVTSRSIFESFKSEERYGIPYDWMEKNMGVIERRVSLLNQTPSDLAIMAAENALEGWSSTEKNEIGAVIFCGIERDQPEPATAHEVQKRLGLEAGIVLDVANACFGFFDGLRIAFSFIQTKVAKKVLVVTGEIPTRLTSQIIGQLSKGVSEAKLKSSIGYLSVGDAGGAIVVGESEFGEESGVNTFETKTMSQYNELCWYKYDDLGNLHAEMHMAKILGKAIKLQEKMIQEAKIASDWRSPEFMMIHQVGKRAFDHVASLNLVDRSKIIKSYDKYGNTTSATFPLNYWQLMSDTRVKAGDNVYACYNGSGISVGHMSLTY